MSFHAMETRVGLLNMLQMFFVLVFLTGFWLFISGCFLIRFSVYVWSACMLHALEFVGVSVYVYIHTGQGQKIPRVVLYSSLACCFEPGSLPL